MRGRYKTPKKQVLAFQSHAGSGKINQAIRAKIIPHITAAPTSECIEFIDAFLDFNLHLLYLGA